MHECMAVVSVRRLYGALAKPTSVQRTFPRGKLGQALTQIVRGVCCPVRPPGDAAEA